jgi:hypothetical protein
MSNYDNNNRGAVWPNKEKKTDKHPDFTGTALVNGVDHFVSAWKKGPSSHPDAPIVSLSFTVKDKQPHSQPPQQSQEMAQAKSNNMEQWDKGPTDNFNDPIPF